MNLKDYKNIVKNGKKTVYWINEKGKVWNANKKAFQKIYEYNGKKMFNCYDYETKRSRNFSIEKLVTQLFGLKDNFYKKHKKLIIDGKEYDNYYINKNGDVWSTYYCRYLNRQTQVSGYNSIRLSLGQNKYKTCYVHRLVAETWLGPRPEGKEVNHIDINKNNNHVSNLEWVTRTENANKRSNNLSTYEANLPRMFWTKSKYLNVRCVKGNEEMFFKNSVVAGKYFIISPNSIRMFASKNTVVDGWKFEYLDRDTDSYVFKNKWVKLINYYFDGVLTKEHILAEYKTKTKKLAISLILDNCKNIEEVKEMTKSKMFIDVKDKTKFKLVKIKKNYE